MHGRRGERCFGEPYRSDGWRGPEDVIRQEEDWENSYSKKVEQVDHWAVFIEAIGRAGKQNSSSTSGYHTPGESQGLKRSSQSPRNFHRQKMGSSGASHNGAKTYEKVQSPGWSKNEQYSRDSSSRQLQGKRHDRQEAEYLNTERDNGYSNKSFYTERSQKSNYEHPPQPKRLRELDHHSDYRLTHRNSPCAPIIVDHDQGLPHDDERNKNLNPSRTHDQFGHSNPLRSRELGTDQRPPNGRNPPGGFNPGMNQGHFRKMNPLASRDRDMNQGQSRSRDPPRSYDPEMNQRHSRTRDSSRGKDPTMNQEHPKNLDFPRINNAVVSYQHSKKWDPPNSNKFQKDSHKFRKDRNFPRPSRERDPVKHWREFDHHSGMSHETQSGLSYHDIGEETSLQNSLMEREMPVQDRSQHRNYTRMNLHPRQSHRNNTLDLNTDVDLQMNDNRSSMFAQQWQKKMQTGFDDGNTQKQRVPQHKEPKSNCARGDFRGLESLMIKVDTSRPVEQSRYSIAVSGYMYG